MADPIDNIPKDDADSLPILEKELAVANLSQLRYFATAHGQIIAELPRGADTRFAISDSLRTLGFVMGQVFDKGIPKNADVVACFEDLKVMGSVADKIGGASHLNFKMDGPGRLIRAGVRNPVLDIYARQHNIEQPHVTKVR